MDQTRGVAEAAQRDSVVIEEFKMGSSSHQELIDDKAQDSILIKTVEETDNGSLLQRKGNLNESNMRSTLLTLRSSEIKVVQEKNN